MTPIVMSVADKAAISVNVPEALRYLGVKNSDGVTEQLMDECIKEMYKVAEPKAVYCETKITVENSTVDFGFMRVESEKLAKNLCGCYKAYVFCATLGIGVDRQFERLSRISPAKATVFSAVGSSLVEGLCDYANKMIVGDQLSRPRFSCGYGDFSLAHQSDILNVLEAGKRIGVFLTESYMMVPVKTVTAVIGIRR